MSDENLYSYAALRDEPTDLDLFPEERWRELVEGVREEHYQNIISVMANQLSHYWPKSGSLLELTVQECILTSTEALLEIPSMGKKKATTVILILTYLFENLNNSGPTTIGPKIKNKSSKQDYWKSVNSKNWDSICDSIPHDCHSISIQRIAYNLGLKWSDGFWGKLTIERCIECDFKDVCNWRGFGKKRLETLFAVLMHLAKPSINTDKRDLISAHDLLNHSNDDWQSIARGYWKEICGSIPKEYHKSTIQSIANDLGLKWPEKNWGTLTVADCFGHRFSDLFSKNRLGVKKIETIARVLIRLTDPELKSLKGDDYQEIWNHPVIANLTDRKREIFERRLLTVYEKPTLNELGHQYDVCRERIRQIENSIKKQIDSSGLQKHLKKLLDKYIKNELLPKHEKPRYLLKSDVPAVVASMSPELVLAIALNYKSIYQLLTDIAKETPVGWYFGKRSLYNKLVRKLDKKLGNFLPCLTQTAAERFEVDQVDLLAVCLLNKIAFQKGAVLLPYRTGRAEADRATRCFNTAISRYQRFWSINELVNESTEESTPQSLRLYQTAISKSQRLFLSTSSHTISLYNPIQLETITSSFEHSPEFEEEEEVVHAASEVEDSNVSILEKILKKEWPITAKNLREYTLEEPYQIDLADNSLIPTLCSIPSCKRLAPGIYGPNDYSDNPTRLKKARKMALGGGDIRAYCYARRSGENCEEIFPLWDPMQEQLWFRKLQKKSDDDPLLRTFISIADQSKWPEQLDSEALQLMEHTVSAKFLEVPSWINARSYNVPDLVTTLTTLGYARHVAPLSWIRANHITCAWKLIEESGISVLICGLALGLLDPGKRAWFKPIPAANDFDQNWGRIESLFMDKAIPDWSHPVIQGYFETARVLAAKGELGFVKSESLNNFIEKLSYRPD